MATAGVKTSNEISNKFPAIGGTSTVLVSVPLTKVETFLTVTSMTGKVVASSLESDNETLSDSVATSAFDFFDIPATESPMSPVFVCTSAWRVEKICKTLPVLLFT